MKIVIFAIGVILSFTVSSQNLLQERIRKIPTKKKSVYLNGGVFHNGMVKINSKLVGIRHSYLKARKRERLVFDFSTNKIPRIYGYFSKKDKTLMIDFFGTDINEHVGSFGNSVFVKSVTFFPVTKKSLSAEIKLKDNVSTDMFYLESPGRFVIDLKI